MFRLCLLEHHLLQFILELRVRDLDSGSLHSERPGFDDACAFKLTQGIYDNRSGNARSVCDLAGNEQSFFAFQFRENLPDRFDL